MGFGGLWQKNDLPACDKCAFVADPVPGDGIHFSRLPSLQSQSPVCLSPQELLVTGRKLVLAVCLGATLSSLPRGCHRHCLWAARRCGACVSGRHMNVNATALYLSGLGFHWEQGCCTHLWTGAELKTNEASETRHRQSHRQLSYALKPRTPVLVWPPFCFS